jgi:serine/threonine protein kinase
MIPMENLDINSTNINAQPGHLRGDKSANPSGVHEPKISEKTEKRPESIDYMKLLNLIQIPFSSIDYAENLYENSAKTIVGYLHGMPIVAKYIGKGGDRRILDIVSDLSKYSHSSLAVYYGFTFKPANIKAEHRNLNHEEDDIYLVRELVIGTNLYSIHNDKFANKFIIHNKLYILFNLMTLIEYLHCYDVPVCFLNPRHIIITSEFKVKLVDFIQDKIALNEDIKTKTEFTDECRFLHPDIINKSFDDSQGKKYDLYSVAVMFYYVLLNKLPMKNVKTIDEAIVAINDGDVKTHLYELWNNNNNDDVQMDIKEIFPNFDENSCDDKDQKILETIYEDFNHSVNTILGEKMSYVRDDILGSFDDKAVIDYRTSIILFNVF